MSAIKHYCFDDDGEPCRSVADAARIARFDRVKAEVVADARRLGAELGRVLSREECTAVVGAAYARHGLDENGELIPETPDEQRDREEQDDVRWARDHDSHDSSRIR